LPNRLQRIWIARAQPGADETARRVRALGREAVVAPVLQTRALPARLDLADAGALAFTSRNGVAAFAALTDERHLPVFAVGDATAEAARAAGFPEVVSADGDVRALAVLIAGRPPPEGAVVHLGAREPAGDLIGDLSARGVAVRACPIYETVWTSLATPEAWDAVLVHSPRAALAVARRLAGRDLSGRLALAISEAAAAPLRAFNFKLVAAAPFPNEAALLKLVEREP